MNKQRAITVIATAALVLTGCLSKEEPASIDGNSGPGGSDPTGATGSVSNGAPSIWGAPSNAVMTGDNYSFTPSADDPDGDTLSFSIRNKPRWATFDTLTGRLSGRPVLGDEGIYADIVISASDGTASARLGSFSIEVTQSAIGSMTLSWTPPTENEDGSALADLAGYNIYFGEKEGRYPNRVRINNPGITVYVIENLLPKTYYVVATAFNTSGVESAYSDVAVKNVTAD